MYGIIGHDPFQKNTYRTGAPSKISENGRKKLIQKNKSIGAVG
jgi:hypothetical protein